MKIVTLTIATLAATTLSHAQTFVRLTGSTAFRANTHNAIRNIMAAGHTFAFTGSSLSSANQSIFSGTVNSNPVIIKCTWSGSVDGTNTVSNSVPIAFLPDGSTMSVGGTSGTSSVTTSTPGADVSAPDVGMADTFQNSTPAQFNQNPLTQTRVGVVGFKWLVNRGLAPLTVAVSTTSGSNIATVADTSSLTVGMTLTGNANIPTNSKIGAITSGTTFTIVTNSTGAANNATATGSAVNTVLVAPAPFNNFTTQLAKALWVNGSLPLALFTGNTADRTKSVFATGRDPGSGTRLTAFAESGIGVFSSVVQYKPTISSGVISAHIPWPAGTFNGINYSQGNGGETSGGNLVASLTATTNALNGYYISYLSVNDATAAINGGAKELSWHGTYYSDQAVFEGNYPFWCYQFLTYRSSTPTNVKSIADTLALQIRNVDAPILLSQMGVGRTADGGLITPNY
jgi:hypothetical protein